MAIQTLLVCFFVLVAVPVQSADDPWLQDPMLVALWKLTRAINSFGFDLFDNLVHNDYGNMLICPYSLSNALGILHFAAAGDTEKELARVLGYEEFNLTKDEVAQTFYVLSTKQLQSSNPKFYIFDAPSTIMVNRKNGLLPTFQRVVEVLFQAPLTVVDFMESPIEVVRSVNDWVAARTRNKIKHIIGTLDCYADMMIVNSAYFKGVWVHKFPPTDTELGIFYNYGSIHKIRHVNMMRMANILNFHKDEELSILELQFRGRNVSMIILLPNELDGIKDLLAKFSPDFLEEKIMKMRPSEVEVVLPRFETEFYAEMTGYLQDLGIHTLFNPDKVDLSQMIRRDSIILGDVMHKTVISVTELGVEAAAATVIFTFKAIPPKMEERPDFLADHPFLYVIYERRLKLILFMGDVMEF